MAGAPEIGNSTSEERRAFPHEDFLDDVSGVEFFESQSYTRVVEDDGKIVGLYILHPNNVGRCGHICNASYAVSSEFRGQHIGEKLVRDCMLKAKTFLMEYKGCMTDCVSSLGS